MEALYLLISFVVGGALLYFISRYSALRKISDLDKEASLVNERIKILQDENNSWCRN